MKPWDYGLLPNEKLHLLQTCGTDMAYQIAGFLAQEGRLDPERMLTRVTELAEVLRQHGNREGEVVARAVVAAAFQAYKDIEKVQGITA